MFRMMNLPFKRCNGQICLLKWDDADFSGILHGPFLFFSVTVNFLVKKGEGGSPGIQPRQDFRAGRLPLTGNSINMPLPAGRRLRRAVSG